MIILQTVLYWQNDGGSAECCDTIVGSDGSGNLYSAADAAGLLVAASGHGLLLLFIIRQSAILTLNKRSRLIEGFLRLFIMYLVVI
ncbi:unnamed protein product [Gongylonema pulchrum]|uniref:7TM_GPCR_Srx domain-containing protein n=1 Tax=Gongylonema pulchrum TaxID=637853 RepID=A0A183EJ80_9BILA|nr:unnamed protein product [Gongylonema pulchrum]